MGFFSSFTGAQQGRDMKNAYRDSNAVMDQGYGAARGNLAQGYNTANAAYGQARKDITGGYTNALSQLGQGTDKAVAQYQPYADSGASANALYGNALGLNGAASQQSFMQNYQADPFRDANAKFATNALMQMYNARGASGAGTAAAAVAQENLRRGSEDFNNYLNRLQGVQGMGFQAAGSMADIYNNQGRQAAQYGYQQGSDLANIQGQRAATGYNYGQSQAGLNTDLATAKAGNRINLGNALANSRNIGFNNLLSLAGTAINAYGGKLPKMPGYTGSLSGGA